MDDARGLDSVRPRINNPTRGGESENQLPDKSDATDEKQDGPFQSLGEIPARCQSDISCS